MIGTITRGVEYHYNLSTGIYDYTTYDVGSTEITKSYNYDNDSLKRLDNIALNMGSVTLTKIINYDDSFVNPTMGNATTRIHSIIYTKNGIQQAIYIYQYDANNNITGLTVKNQYNQVVDDYDYYYDGFNQLIRENVTLNSGSFSRTYLYSYDDQGNIISIADHAYTLSNPVITTPMVLTYYEYSNTWKDQLTKITEYTNFVKTKEISYSYDANGNPTTITDLMNSYQTKTLNWDGRQLSSMSYYCGGMSFKYNDQGIRTYKSIGGCSGGYSVNYVLDGSRILSETKGTSTIYYTYDADGTLISMNYNGNEYFYITNMQGDVVELVDISGNTVVKYKYDAWGNIIYQTPNQPIGDINPFRYRSYYYDIETGWYYLQSRYYNPSIGRFISADGLVGKMGDVQTLNMYAYCANNPVMRVDPSGELWITLALVTLLVFSVFSTSPQLQNAVAEVTTVTTTDGSIEKGSFGFGKAVYAKAVYLAINEDGYIKDVYGNIIDEIASTSYFDAQYIYGSYTMYEDGSDEYSGGATVAGFYIGFDYSDGRFELNGGISATFRYGLGLKSGSKTFDFNPVGYFWNLLFPEE